MHAVTVSYEVLMHLPHALAFGVCFDHDTQQQLSNLSSFVEHKLQSLHRKTMSQD